MNCTINPLKAGRHYGLIMILYFFSLLTRTINPFIGLLSQSLQQLNSYIQSHENIQAGLFNSGITNTGLCAAFSFEIVKWLRKSYSENIKLNSFEADDGRISNIFFLP